MLVLSTRVALLRAHGMIAEAGTLLDAYVKRDPSPSTHLMRARFLVAIGRPEQAEKDYLRIAEIDTSSRGRQLLADFYRSTGRPNQAEKELRQGLKDHADDLMLKRSLLAFLLQRRGKSDLAEAEKILDGLEAQLGQRADLLWARAALMTARSTKPVTLHAAQMLLKQSVKLEPTFVRGHVAMIQMALAEKDYAQARLRTEDALKANPASIPLLVEQVRVELGAGQFSTAADLARNMLEIEAGNRNARALLVSAAMGARSKDDLQHVRSVLRQALVNDSRDPNLHLANARILSTLGQDKAAISGLDSYARTNAGKRSGPVMLALTRLYRQQGDPFEAVFWLGQAAKLLGDNNPSVLTERLWLRAMQKKFDDVASIAATHDSSSQANQRVLATAAAILATSGVKKHVSQAERLYRRAMDLAPQWIFPKRGLANLLYHTGKVDQAEKLYRQVLEQDENDVQALNGLAWILAETRKDYKAALPLIEKAVKLAPNDRQVRDTRGVILSNLPGREPDARKDFEKCVELTAPDSIPQAKALLQLGRLCQRLEDHAAARKHLEDALRIDAKNRALTPEQRTEIAEILKGLPGKPTS